MTVRPPTRTQSGVRGGQTLGLLRGLSVDTVVPDPTPCLGPGWDQPESRPATEKVREGGNLLGIQVRIS